GGRGDPQVDLAGPGVPDQLDEPGAGGAPDDGVVHHDDPLALDRLPQGVELQPHAALPLVLAGLDEGPADVAVFDEPHAVGDAGATGVADGGGDAGVRHAHDHVRPHGVLQ